MADIIVFPGKRVDLRVGPFTPPDRCCFICDFWAWSWNGTAYQCVSKSPLHAEREMAIEANPQHYYAQGGDRV